MLAFGLQASAQKIPVVFGSENTAKDCKVDVKTCSFENLPRIETLPDPFLFANGQRSSDYKDWEKHRAEIIHYLQKYEIGEKPAVDKSQVWAALDGDVLKINVTVGDEIFCMKAKIEYPEGDGPFDGCV